MAAPCQGEAAGRGGLQAAKKCADAVSADVLQDANSPIPENPIPGKSLLPAINEDPELPMVSGRMASPAPDSKLEAHLPLYEYYCESCDVAFERLRP